MVMYADPIRPIYEMPGHRHYGPCRRMSVMLEQLFADRGGLRIVEIGMQAWRDNRGMPSLTWDAHLGWLIDQGQGEAGAQRIVMQQLLMAAEFIS